MSPATIVLWVQRRIPQLDSRQTLTTREQICRNQLRYQKNILLARRRTGSNKGNFPPDYGNLFPKCSSVFVRVVQNSEIRSHFVGTSRVAPQRMFFLCTTKCIALDSRVFLGMGRRTQGEDCKRKFRTILFLVSVRKNERRQRDDQVGCSKQVCYPKISIIVQKCQQLDKNRN